MAKTHLLLLLCIQYITGVSVTFSVCLYLRHSLVLFCAALLIRTPLLTHLNFIYSLYMYNEQWGKKSSFACLLESLSIMEIHTAELAVSTLIIYQYITEEDNILETPPSIKDSIVSNGHKIVSKPLPVSSIKR